MLYRDFQYTILASLSAMVLSKDLQLNALLEITTRVVNRKFNNSISFHPTAFSKFSKEINKKMEKLKEESEKAASVGKN